MSSTTKVWNFGAGPAAIPAEVLAKAQAEFLDFNNTGMSVLEISHRSKTFDNLLKKTKNDLRQLLNIPENYKILFMQGGGHTQFSAVVYNLVAAKRAKTGDYSWNPPVDYVITGSWSAKSVAEAKRLYANVNIAADAKVSGGGKFGSIPPRGEWKLSGPDAAYVYYCDNETINGVEFPYIPDIDPSVPLVCDMSSNILSRKFDVSKFGVIYAGAQKNVGPAGVTIVIVREDLLVDQPKTVAEHSAGSSGMLMTVPSMLDYKIMADTDSLYNTPPVFAVYMAGLVFDYLIARGGVQEIEKVNGQKAKLLYDYIDQSKIYQSHIDPKVRSRMNVPFRINPPELEAQFLAGAEALRMYQLKGHRSVGGLRASIYNAMTLEGVTALIDYMKAFEKKHSA
ncbi:6118_t:CDS:1 [Paraglomus brasilianum]|uniref:Phosphoserine aminotransferase n=1 Tax=Paraglomus brasilianum TaxID=144538 RepID=A0A9N9DNB9_9GLOM|nr:6118_t:CDS:1 [Paraglomus brasilianum]